MLFLAVLKYLLEIGKNEKQFVQSVQKNQGRVSWIAVLVFLWKYVFSWWGFSFTHMFEPVDTSEMFDFPVRDTKVPVEPFNLSKIPYCAIQFELRIPNAKKRRYLGPHLLTPSHLPGSI